MIKKVSAKNISTSTSPSTTRNPLSQFPIPKQHRPNSTSLNSSQTLFSKIPSSVNPTPDFPTHKLPARINIITETPKSNFNNNPQFGKISTKNPLIASKINWLSNSSAETRKFMQKNKTYIPNPMKWSYSNSNSSPDPSTPFPSNSIPSKTV